MNALIINNTVCQLADTPFVVVGCVFGVNNQVIASTDLTDANPWQLIPNDVVVAVGHTIKDGVLAPPQPSAAHIWDTKTKAWLEDATLAAELLQQQQHTAWQAIKAHRDKIKAGGVLVSVAGTASDGAGGAGVEKWYHTNPDSRFQFLALINMAATNSIPDNLQWKTMDGSFVTMTAAIAQKVFTATATLDITAFTAAEQHRATMLASETPAEYDHSSGWPTTHP